jgi:hypothetical protein
VIEDDSLAAAGTCVSTAGSLAAGAAGEAAAGAGDAALTKLGFADTGAVTGAVTTELERPDTTGLDTAAGVASCDISIESCG